MNQKWRPKRPKKHPKKRAPANELEKQKMHHAGVLEGFVFVRFVEAKRGGTGLYNSLSSPNPIFYRLRCRMLSISCPF